MLAKPIPLPPIPDIPRLTLAERAARGRVARASVPRRSHASWDPSPTRPDPVALLERQSASRTAELVPIRYGRMLASPFAFYRGGAAIMAADLASTPRTGITTQLCGDAHLLNFGLFRTPERTLVFSLNDFDETLPGPWEWDVKRLVASIEIAGRDRGFGQTARRDAVLAGARTYRQAVARFAAMRDLEVWYARLDTGAILRRLESAGLRTEVKWFARGVARSETKDSLRAFARLTSLVDGEPRIVSDPPLIVPVEELLSDDARVRYEEVMTAFLSSYRESLPPDRRWLLSGYRFAHMAHKVVGVGSVGTRAWIVLMLGRERDDPLFLQLKEAQASVLESFLGQDNLDHHGRRVVEGQRLMQAASDILLGWYRLTAFDGNVHDFYVRQLWDGKGSLDVETMRPATLRAYAMMCGWTLARAHARSGDRIAIAAYLGRSAVFDNVVADFAASYADQNERDYRALTAAVASGRVVARTGV